MSPIDKKTVAEKLNLLKEVIGKLEKTMAVSKEDFLQDFYVSDTAIRNLVLGIEIIVDIGNHLLSEQFQDSAKTYKDVILKLGRKGIVPEDFAISNAEMTDFRNLIIHAYMGLDLNKVHEHLQKAPDTFRQFAKYFVEFLEKQQEK